MQVAEMMESPTKLLHAVPNFINQKEYGAGNWKAVGANRLALDRAGITYTTIEFDPENPTKLLEQMRSDIAYLLMEYGFWPELLVKLRREHPQVKIVVRTHNAEAYHYFHRTIIASRRNYVNPKHWFRFIQLARRDTRCRQAAHMLLGISEWDNKNYWSWLRGQANIRYLPYYSPWPYLRPDVDIQSWNLRNRAIISLGGNFDPSGMANVANFDILATKLSRVMDEKWSYLLTWWSQWHRKVPTVGEGIEIVRECREPWDLLCQSRALAVLTPLGFGFKTTVVDGLAAGCHVIIHPTLANRLPQQVKQLCLICDPSRDQDIIRLADSLSTPPRPHSLNQQLREMVIADFRSIFI
jgi:hypothetical protein